MHRLLERCVLQGRADDEGEGMERASLATFASAQIGTARGEWGWAGSEGGRRDRRMETARREV